MGTYKVRVATRNFLLAGTFSSISITLVGTHEESDKKPLDNCGKDFNPGAVTFIVRMLLLIAAPQGSPTLLPTGTNWYCSFVEVISPHGQTYRFPCYQWIEGYRTLELREGQTVCDDADCPLLLEQRQAELTHRRKCYGPVRGPGDGGSGRSCRTVGPGLWLRVAGFGWAGCIDAASGGTQLRVSLGEGMHTPVVCICTPQLYACAQICVCAPQLCGSPLPNTGFAAPSCPLILAPGSQSLGSPGEAAGFTPPACTPSPPASFPPQLSQCPGPDSPIFLPSDSEWDWILAKTWVRYADFLVHESVSHLLLTHLIDEAFTLATLRQLPMCHPLFKLLLPHTRYTLHINTLKALSLVPSQGMGSGVEGTKVLMAKGMSCLTYNSLCLPDDIQERGVDCIPNYYYRDDRLKIWSAIESFVSGIVRHYYHSDAHVLADCELQAWADEIFREGFLGNEASGFPSSLQSIPELIKYLTMWIYCCSARHAALNNGQFGAWMPNFPASMRNPPPQAKGTTSLESYLDTIPEVNSTSIAIFTLWVICCEPGDSRSLGTYPDEHFTEEEPKQLIKAFQGRLAQISQGIQERNKSLPIPYRYLDPCQIENSTSI
uniref:Arachidonate lipoxygenase 3 n=1 Tax=Chelonoidis abingdonii TaxID=106734 RepID=A0A8C0H8L9_CHEAB